MKTINTYRKISGKILRKLEWPINKTMIRKLSHFLNKIEKEQRSGPDYPVRRYTCDELFNKFIDEIGPEGIQTRFYFTNQ